VSAVPAPRARDTPLERLSTLLDIRVSRPCRDCHRDSVGDAANRKGFNMKLY
jgi:hypothetical protein